MGWGSEVCQWYGSPRGGRGNDEPTREGQRQGRALAVDNRWTENSSAVRPQLSGDDGRRKVAGRAMPDAAAAKMRRRADAPLKTCPLSY